MATAQQYNVRPNAPGRFIAAPRFLQAQRASLWRVLPLVLLTYTFLILPIEVKYVFGGFNIYAYRVTILLMIPIALYRTIREARSITLADLLVFVSCIWTVISFSKTYGVESGFIRGAALFLDAFGAFVIARSSVRTLNDIRAFLILVLPGLVIAAGLFAVESITGRLLVRPFFRSIFGQSIFYEGGVAQGALEYLDERRLGLRRAYGAFSFPILGGIIFASLLPLYIKSGIRSWPFLLGVCASLAAVFSISSAVFIALALGVGMLIVDKLLPWLRPLNWYYITAAVGFYGVLANFVLETGIAGLIGRFTLNPATAYVRRMQWHYGMQSIAEHPLFGIGFNAYERADWMTAAIDAHFLGLGIRDGAITPLFLLAAIVVIVATLGHRSIFQPRHDRNLLIGVNFMIALLVFAAMTVTYFSEGNIWFMMVLGIGSACTAVVRTQAMQRRLLPMPMQASIPGGSHRALPD